MAQSELDAATRRRYARQISLPEIGEDGQMRLRASGFRIEPGARVAEVAADYLRRAGCVERSIEGELLEAANPQEVERFAGAPELLEAAAVILGAWAAVERVKRVCGIGSVGDLPPSLTLAGASSAQPGDRPKS